ncbi:DUF2637 domain-containing protein [Salinactinospora qingdaonensis]|uniref:DUF2637 domain-containing protein n=1 Tax=Salinactinospora qingdaonensis TaxID=702744 RepID=A0ABP7F733_9ACTN
MGRHPSSESTGARPTPRNGGVQRRRTIALTGLGVLVIAACAVVLSYTGIYQIAITGGITPGLAHLYPAVFTLLLVFTFAATYLLRDAPRRRRTWIDALVLGLISIAALASAMGSMDYELAGPVAAVLVAVAPWGALLIAFRCWMWIVVHLREDRRSSGKSRRRPTRRQPQQPARRPPPARPTPAPERTPAPPAEVDWDPNPAEAPPLFPEPETGSEDAGDDLAATEPMATAAGEAGADRHPPEAPSEGAEGPELPKRRRDEGGGQIKRAAAVPSSPLVSKTDHEADHAGHGDDPADTAAPEAPGETGERAEAADSADDDSGTATGSTAPADSEAEESAEESEEGEPAREADPHTAEAAQATGTAHSSAAPRMRKRPMMRKPRRRNGSEVTVEPPPSADVRSGPTPPDGEEPE